MRGRLFVGLGPPERLRRQIERDLAALSDVPQSTWVDADQLHVTLRFLGEVTVGVRSFDRLRTACSEVPARTVRFGPTLRFLGDRALVVPVEGVDDLVALARATTAKASGLTESARFTGHMTVARPGTGREHAWTRTAIGTKLTGRWLASEVCVFVSGNGYQVLDRIPLAGILGAEPSAG